MGSSPTRRTPHCLLFFIITGKGGVGKSTCSVLLANHLSNKGKTVLYFSTHSPVYKFTKNNVNLYYLDVEKEAKEYLKLKLPFFMWYPLSKSSVFRVFSRLIPGFSELIMLGKMWYDFYTNKYDFYVFDGLPTGQIIPFLKIPQAGIKSGVRGKVRADFEKMDEFTKQVKIILVSLPEQVVHEESEEFISHIRRENLEIFCIFLNMFYERNLSDQDIRWLETILIEGKLKKKEKEEIKDMIHFERFFSENSQKYYTLFKNMGFDVVKIPFSFSGTDKNFFENFEFENFKFP